jgi:hypothetical protein
LLATEAPVHEEYRRRLIHAVETDAEWYPDLFEVGWPDAPHRAIRDSTADAWEAAGRPAPGRRPREGEEVARWASGEPIVRYSVLALEGITGDVGALSLWAGQSVALANDRNRRLRSSSNSPRACSRIAMVWAARTRAARLVLEDGAEYPRRRKAGLREKYSRALHLVGPRRRPRQARIRSRNRLRLVRASRSSVRGGAPRGS